MHQLRNREEIGLKNFGVLSWCKNPCYVWANYFWGLWVILYFLTLYQKCEKNH